VFLCQIVDRVCIAKEKERKSEMFVCFFRYVGGAGMLH
jgi:hypothetical protein